jgi:hypothetical protein
LRHISLFYDLQAIDRGSSVQKSVIAGFANPDGSQPVLRALLDECGQQNVVVLFGPEGLRILAPTGDHDAGLGRSDTSEAAATDHAPPDGTVALRDASENTLRKGTATLRRGGYVVLISITDEKHQGRAVEILKAHGADWVVDPDRSALE